MKEQTAGSCSLSVLAETPTPAGDLLSLGIVAFISNSVMGQSQLRAQYDKEQSFKYFCD